MLSKLYILTIGRVMQMVIMFATYRILSTVLSVSDMGVYYFLLSISAAFGLIFANPLGMYANRVLHSWQESNVLVTNLKTLTKVLLAGSLFTVPFLFIFKNKLNIDSQSLALIISVLVFYVFASSFNGTIVPSLNLLGHSTHFVVWTFGTSAVGLMASLLMVNIFSANPLYWLIGQAFSFFLFGIVAFVILEKRSKKSELKSSVSRQKIERVASFALPVVVTNLAVWSLGQSFRFFYKDNVDSVQLGELAFGLGLATSLSVAVEYLFHQLFFPEFYQKINTANTDKGKIWNNLFNRVVPSYFYFIFFMIGLAPFIMRILADEKFKNAQVYLAMGAGIELLRMTGNIFTMATQSEMKTQKAIFPYVTGGFFTLAGVLIISKQPEWIWTTPFVLIGGYLIANILLLINIQKMFPVSVSPQKFTKNLTVSILFLSALFWRKFSESLPLSFIICIIYGLFLAFLLYKAYVNHESEK